MKIPARRGARKDDGFCGPDPLAWEPVRDASERAYGGRAHELPRETRAIRERRLAHDQARRPDRPVAAQHHAAAA